MGEVCHMRTDGNSIRELTVLREKIANREMKGYSI